MKKPFGQLRLPTAPTGVRLACAVLFTAMGSTGCSAIDCATSPSCVANKAVDGVVWGVQSAGRVGGAVIDVAAEGVGRAFVKGTTGGAKEVMETARAGFNTVSTANRYRQSLVTTQQPYAPAPQPRYAPQPQYVPQPYQPVTPPEDMPQLQFPPPSQQVAPAPQLQYQPQQAAPAPQPVAVASYPQQPVQPSPTGTIAVPDCPAGLRTSDPLAVEYMYQPDSVMKEQGISSATQKEVKRLLQGCFR